MAKAVKNTCIAPKLKELPAEFSKQISISADDSDVLIDMLVASLPQLAKKASSNQYGTNSAVKALNLASSLHEVAKPVNDDFNQYHGGLVFKLAGELGINTNWRYQTDCGEGSADIRELYDSTQVEVHVVFSKKLKDKKDLAKRGVK